MQVALQEPEHVITGKQKKGLVLCAIVILVIYAVLTVYFGVFMSNARTQSNIGHKNRMDASKVDTKYPPQKPNFTEVKVGSYLENIRDLSIADSSFSADFYIWFTWQGDKDLNPGELFQIVGGKIEFKDLSSEHYNDELPTL